MAREDHLIVWPVFIFVSVIMVLLVLDDALSVFFESAARSGSGCLCSIEVGSSRDQDHAAMTFQVSKLFGHTREARKQPERRALAAYPITIESAQF
jgi:hypothetical protein